MLKCITKHELTLTGMKITTTFLEEEITSLYGFSDFKNKTETEFVTNFNKSTGFFAEGNVCLDLHYNYLKIDFTTTIYDDYLLDIGLYKKKFQNELKRKYIPFYKELMNEFIPV